MTSIVEGEWKIKDQRARRGLTEGWVSFFSPTTEAGLWMGLLEDVILGRGF